MYLFLSKKFPINQSLQTPTHFLNHLTNYNIKVQSAFMEENKKQILHGNCPGKLNLNLPLLSTRRPFRITIDNNLILPNDNTNMVPFSWERIPGQPKDKGTNESFSDIDLPPPPGRWQPPLDWAVDRCCNGSNEQYSDVNDIFSLAESINDMEVATEGRILTNNGYHSPNFIIQRFLPDAQALAEESVLNKKLPFLNSPSHVDDSFSRAVSIRRSCYSPKGCGLGSFLPWRVKAKPCSVKAPVCDTIIGADQKQNR